MRLTVSRWSSLLIAICGLLIALSAVPVFAHGYIVRAIPEDRARLDRPPARVQIWFSEDLEPEFSSITIRDSAGETIASGELSSANRSLLEARLPTGLADGAYVIDLRIAFASDGHVIAQSQVFFVGETVSEIAGISASDQAVTLEVVWRGMLLASLSLLIGTFTAYALVFVPAWGNRAFAAGLLPPRVMRRLSLLIAVGLIIAVLGNLLALLQQSMAFFGADAGRVLSEGLWNVVRIGTRFGDTWNVRMLLLIVIGAAFVASHYYRERQPEFVRPFWTASAWAAALLFATMSVASHAAGSLTLPWVALSSDWLHGTAAGIWIGGLMAVVWVTPVALAPLEGDARRLAMLSALRRFSVIATACLFVVIATGVYNASNWLTAPADLSTRYGGTLIIKVLFTALLIVLGAVQHAALRPERYAKVMTAVERLQRWVPITSREMNVGLVVLVAAAYLSATPVPEPEIAQSPAPSITQALDDLQFTTTITPGGTGVNSYDVVVTQDGRPVDDLALMMQIVSPSQDIRGDWQAVEFAGDGVYIGASADVNQTGDWLALLHVGAGESARQLVFPFPVTPEANVISSRPPSVITWVALLAVLGAVIYALTPSAKRLIRVLDLSPVTVTVALGATAVTIGIVVITAALIEQSSAQYNATINPPPSVVNTVLPDEASLGRGETLLAECGWPDQPDFPALLRELPRRDDALFELTRRGWRGLMPCPAEDPSRWDIVNALRSLAVREQPVLSEG